MLSVILLVIIALAFGFFATQNPMEIPISFGYYYIPDVPLYVVIGVTLLLGLLFSWIVSLVDSFFFARNLRSKDHTINDAKKSNEVLNKKILELEMENTRLKALNEND
ncbi:MAG: LapA family protein [bacterium]|nr:LapA family protein [bacterium]